MNHGVTPPTIDALRARQIGFDPLKYLENHSTYPKVLSIVDELFENFIQPDRKLREQAHEDSGVALPKRRLTSISVLSRLKKHRAKYFEKSESWWEINDHYAKAVRRIIAETYVIPWTESMIDKAAVDAAIVILKELVRNKLANEQEVDAVRHDSTLVTSTAQNSRTSSKVTKSRKSGASPQCATPLSASGSGEADESSKNPPAALLPRGYGRVFNPSWPMETLEQIQVRLFQESRDAFEEQAGAKKS